ncbi:glycosyltransferase [Candidatus Bathyarchaeota archaeon]|nr:glycosyltransferase [Candidatus Bathyarchaeota archaeon]
MDRSNLPSISIIIPTKNSRGTLKPLLDSLMELDYDWDKLEVIVVDGDREGRVEKIVSEYPFIIVKDEGRGLNRARNIGFKRSTHEIVAFTDDDCVVPEDWALRIAESFSDPSVGFVGGRVMAYSREGLLSAYVEETLVPMTPRFEEKIVTRKLEFLNLPAGCNMAFRREVLERINLFDERITYGFDDLEPVERVVDLGFNIVLDPAVRILHKHRTRLGDFLRQNFRYGRGGTLYLLTRKERRPLSRWLLAYLIGVFSGLTILSLLLAAALLMRLPLLIGVALGLLASPWLILMGLYARRLKNKRSIKGVALYPLIDILRGFAFALGALYQLLVSAFKGR